MKQTPKTIVRTLLLCLFAMALTVCSPDSTVTTGSLGGYVYDARTGEPLSGVELTLLGGVRVLIQAPTGTTTSAA